MAIPKIAEVACACTRCGKPINAGEPVLYFNRPAPRSPYHAQCPSPFPTTEPSTTEETAPVTPADKIAANEARIAELEREIERKRKAAAGGPNLHVQTVSEARPETEPPPVAPPPALSPLDVAVDARIKAHLEGFNPRTAVDVETVRKIVRDAVRESGASTTIEIKRPSGETATVEGAHYMLPRAARLAESGFALYLHGGAGSGKTTLAIQVSKALGRHYELDTLTRDTSRTMIQGFRAPNGDHMETPFTRTYPAGGAYLPDELDAAPAAVQGMLNSALANGETCAAWGTMNRHALWIFIGTGNTPLRPTPEYPDRQNGNEAFKDRLYFIHVPTDRNIMRRKCGLPADWTPPARVERTCTPQEWCLWVERMMDWAPEGCPTIKVTPRAAIEGVKALACGETPEEVAHGLVFRGADSALVNKALAACPLP